MADFRGADLAGADLTATDLAGASFNGANLTGANLGGARGLTQRQLDASCGDARTLLPPGLTAPDCRRRR